MKINIKALTQQAVMPTYSTSGAGCFDICASQSLSVVQLTCRSVPTSLAFEIPPGHVMLVYSRSGHGFRDGVSLVNSVGVIDSDYRGELLIGVRNAGAKVFHVHQGDRIAQAMIIPIPAVTFAWADQLGTTGRGDGGFGSTGA